MDHPAGVSDDCAPRVDFDRRPKLEFHGSRITSDACLLAYRELADAHGLTDLAGSALSGCRRGKNTRHLLGRLLQHIKGGKNAVTWTRLSCMRFAANAVRLQLHALAYNLGNFLRILALPDAVKDWSPTTLRDRPIKIGSKIVRHGRSVAFQMAEVMAPRALSVQIFSAIVGLRPSPSPAQY